MASADFWLITARIAARRAMPVAPLAAVFARCAAGSRRDAWVLVIQLHPVWKLRFNDASHAGQISPGKNAMFPCTSAAFTVGAAPMGFAVMCQLASAPSAFYAVSVRRLAPLRCGFLQTSPDRLAALIPPPRRHRHRYYLGVLAPNSPLRSAVTALAGRRAETPAAQTPAAAAGAPPPAPASASAETAQAAEEPIHRRAARYAWALLLARIYEVFPLLCPKCGGGMRIIAFITEAPAVRETLAYLGEPTSAPRMAPARGPPLWERGDAGQGPFDPNAQPAPDYDFDQRIAW